MGKGMLTSQEGLNWDGVQRELQGQNEISNDLDWDELLVELNGKPEEGFNWNGIQEELRVREDKTSDEREINWDELNKELFGEPESVGEEDRLEPVDLYEMSQEGGDKKAEPGKEEEREKYFRKVKKETKQMKETSKAGLNEWWSRLSGDEQNKYLEKWGATARIGGQLDRFQRNKLGKKYWELRGAYVPEKPKQKNILGDEEELVVPEKLKKWMEEERAKEGLVGWVEKFVKKINWKTLAKEGLLSIAPAIFGAILWNNNPGLHEAMRNFVAFGSIGGVLSSAVLRGAEIATIKHTRFTKLARGLAAARVATACVAQISASTGVGIVVSEMVDKLSADLSEHKKEPYISLSQKTTATSEPIQTSTVTPEVKTTHIPTSTPEVRHEGIQMPHRAMGDQPLPSVGEPHIDYQHQAFSAQGEAYARQGEAAAHNQPYVSGQAEVAEMPKVPAEPGAHMPPQGGGRHIMAETTGELAGQTRIPGEVLGQLIGKAPHAGEIRQAIISACQAGKIDVSSLTDVQVQEIARKMSELFLRVDNVVQQVGVKYTEGGMGAVQQFFGLNNPETNLVRAANVAISNKNALEAAGSLFNQIIKPIITK